MLPAAIAAALLAGIVIGAVITRRRNRIRHEAGLFDAATDAIVAGAEPVILGESGGSGVLVLHGFGDTPQSVRGLAELLHHRGWCTRAPLLRGHGASLSAFTRSRADQWLADARTVFAELRTRCSTVAIVGQSMGGALAMVLAAESRVDALVLLAPYMSVSRHAARIARFHRLVAVFWPYLKSRSESSIRDPEARLHALGMGVMTPRLVLELSRVVLQAREAAPRVRVPTLVIHSTQDPRVSAEQARDAFAALGSKTKVLKWATRSGHVLSVDYDRDWIAAEVADWLETHTFGKDFDAGVR